MIAVKNGILQFTESNVDLLPFSPDIFVTTQLPVVYNPEAKSDAWLNFIQQIQPNEEDRHLLQECLGTILLKEDLHYIFWLYGNTGRNGKGTVIRTMFTIFGTANCSAVSVTEMDGKHQFALYEMTNSLINVSPEPPIERILTIQLLQSLTGGDAISTERKGIQTRTKHTFFTKQLIMGNLFPRILKATQAFYERMIFINFPNSFTGEKQIIHIERQWLETEEDKSAILNWLIEGTLRVLKNGKKIKKPKSQNDVELKFKRASDTIGAFVIEGIEKAGIHAYVPKRDVQAHYHFYCEQHDFQPDRKAQRLNEEIAKIEGVKTGSKNINGEKTKVWFGLKLKKLDDFDDGVENRLENTLDCYSNDESGTTGTVGTGIFAVKIAEKNENINGINDGSTGSTGSYIVNNAFEVAEGYRQLVCVFCQKSIMDNDWVQNSFTENKPAHVKCCVERLSQLNQSLEMSIFEDKCHASTEDF
ncbi:MAG: DUF5906 domain-containing protein [Nitrososphaerota archaeon]|jgi:P4 family phage/plasmid primase-like protien|nr:DUF5906 domain-containing protein [Nitrososphaerota archaeon]